MFIVKGHSLMVEQWSSKSHAWVRFLLSLIIRSVNRNKNSSRFNSKPYYNNKHDNKPNYNNKYDNNRRNYNNKYDNNKRNYRFRIRPFNVLFRHFKNKNTFLNKKTTSLPQKDQFFFFFTRSFLTNLLLSYSSANFLNINNHVF